MITVISAQQTASLDPEVVMTTTINLRAACWHILHDTEA